MAFTLFTGVDFIATVTDASFRLFKNVSDAFTALGFIKTADTGQVNWTTVTYPGTGVRTAYEIRTMTNPALSLYPVFVKITYFYIGTQGYISFQIGTGSNGTGTLTGIGTNPVLDCIVTPPAASSGKTTWAMSYDGDGFALLSGGSATINRFFLSVEALRDSSGTPVLGQMAIIRQWGTAAGNSDGSWFDLTTLTWQTYRSVPVDYFDTVTTSTASLAYSQFYPFSCPTLLTPNGVYRTKMFVGLAAVDFVPGALLRVPRYSPAGLVPYFFYRAGDATSPGNFGNSGAASYAAPAIYWV